MGKIKSWLHTSDFAPEPDEHEKFRQVFKQLNIEKLHQTPGDDFGSEINDFMLSSPEERSSQFFLDFYSPSGIEFAFEKYGIFDVLKKKGFENLIIHLDTKESYRQRLAVYYEIEDPEHLLSEIVLRKKHITLNSCTESKENDFEVLFVEWLFSQNPTKKFTRERPKLPGQNNPGLNTGRIVLQLLLVTAERLSLSGVLNVPEYFHNAHIYSPKFSYISPECEGKRQAISRDLIGKYDLASVSWAIETGCVTENDLPFKWFVSEQLVPLHQDLIKYFKLEKYQDCVEKAKNNFKYSIDENSWQMKKEHLNDLN